MKSEWVDEQRRGENKEYLRGRYKQIRKNRGGGERSTAIVRGKNGSNQQD